LLLFGILRPPAEESQASLLEDETTWSRQAVPAEVVPDSPASEELPEVCRDHPNWSQPEELTS